MINVQDEQNTVYISFDEDYLSRDAIYKLKDYLKKNIITKSIAVDLKGVESAQHDFFLLLKEFSAKKNFSLYNVGTDINLLINIMNYRQHLKIYVNKDDCKNKKHEMVYRKFKLC